MSRNAPPALRDSQNTAAKETVLEVVIFGGTYMRWEICSKKSIRLAYSWKANKKKKELLLNPFCFVALCIFFLHPSEGKRNENEIVVKLHD